MKTLLALLLLGGAILMWLGGYYAGKREADRWWQHESLATTFKSTYNRQTEPISTIPNALLLNTTGGETVLTVGMDGKVTFGKGFTKDAASKQFWEQFGEQLAEHCQTRLAPPTYDEKTGELRFNEVPAPRANLENPKEKQP
jgi:hypothetical protein